MLITVLSVSHNSRLLSRTLTSLLCARSDWLHQNDISTCVMQNSDAIIFLLEQRKYLLSLLFMKVIRVQLSDNCKLILCIVTYILSQAIIAVYVSLPVVLHRHLSASESKKKNNMIWILNVFISGINSHLCIRNTAVAFVQLDAILANKLDHTWLHCIPFISPPQHWARESCDWLWLASSSSARVRRTCTFDFGFDGFHFVFTGLLNLASTDKAKV